MEIDLSHRTAVVTGSTAGIGFAIAQGLAGCGATVVLNGRKANSVEDAIARMKRLVPRATTDDELIAGTATVLASFDFAGSLVTHPDIPAPSRGTAWRYETRADVHAPL